MNTPSTTRVKGLVESKTLCESARRRQVPKRIRLIQAEAALKLGDAGRASELAQDILEEDSTHLGALETFAKSLWRSGRFEQVVAATDKMLSLNAYEPGYHALRGAALQAMGRYGEAVQCYDRSRELPNSAHALRELQIWQAGLLSEMLQTDPVFKASYAQNPEAACRARGFHFAEQTAGTWAPPAFNRSWSYTRPS
jgi:tetratricopeptide (TPR) repeat protein